MAFLLTYIYVSGKNFKIFSLFSVILIFFSNTIIFIIFGFFCAYLYRNIYNLKSFISKNFLYILVIPFVFIIYYLGYIRYQAVSGFYEYWDNFFLPHDILSYPKFISEVLLDIFVGYTPFGKTRVLPIYIHFYIGFILAILQLQRYICSLYCDPSYCYTS
ncbi:Uncharacterised protein [Helicobacter muridarum]|uniref:Uncharacterized protein n=1 Tax=Helicobacter muridarum TaxID=216 RepID=A0A377PUE3_9HELI|nr:Uncharacterised protein [Helicobacter muridarum]